jgi:glycosyltransferase involved in cell wall biosynthesis
MTTKTVCVVAPVHNWDDVRVFQKEARTLVQAGYRVTLITRASRPHDFGGIRILPARTVTSSRFLRFLALPAVFIQALRINADVYHLHNPDTLMIAAGLKMLGRKCIYDTHEDFSRRILARTWLPRPIRPIMARAVTLVERISSRYVDACIVTQPEVLSRLSRSTVVIGNPPRLDPALFARVKRLSKSIRKDFSGLRAVYIGSITPERGLFEMVQALEIANAAVPVRLWLIGPCSRADLRAATTLPGWQYVDYIAPQPQEQAFAYLLHADVGLIVLRDVGDHATTDPNKLYEYLAFGLPFIASNFQRWRERLDGVTAGLYVKPGDANALAEAEIEMARDPAKREQMGQRGRAFVQAYNWENESIKLLELYRQVLSAA